MSDSAQITWQKAVLKHPENPVIVAEMLGRMAPDESVLCRIRWQPRTQPGGVTRWYSCPRCQLAERAEVARADR